MSKNKIIIIISCMLMFVSVISLVAVNLLTNTVNSLQSEVNTLVETNKQQQALKPLTSQCRYENYSITDLIVLNQILAELREAEEGHFIRLDMNNDGVLDVLDLGKLRNRLAE